MLSFLNPAALWVLLIVPLLFFARRRPQRQRVRVANLYLWRVSTPTGTSVLTRRLRRHRLFLLQALVLVALVLALARPLLSFGTRSYVVIVDASLSMAAREGPQTRLEIAKRQAASFVEGLPWMANVRVIAAGATPRALGQFRESDPALGRVVGAIEQTLGSSDLVAAIQLARSLGQPADRLAIFTDLAPPIPPTAPSNIDWTVVGKPAENVAITALGVLRRPVSANVAAAVTNYSGSVATRTVVLEQGGRTIVRERIEIAPGRTRTVNAVAGLSDGTIAARIDGDDALPEDNQRQAAVPPARRVRVLLTGSAFFVEQALRAHPDVDVTVAPASAAHDVVVCAGCSELPAGNASVLLIPPGESTTRTPMTPREIDHPLLDGVGLSDLSIMPVAMRREAPEGSVVATAGDLPAIVAHVSGTRRVVEWRFDVSNETVALSPAFPLLVVNAIDWLTRSQQNPTVDDAANESDLRSTRVAVVPAALGARSGTDEGFSSPGEITTLLLVLAFGALLLEWRHRTVLGEKTSRSRWLVAALVVLAVTGLQIPGGTAPLSVMFVLDRSDSVSGAEAATLGRVRALSQSMQPGDRAGLVVFGAEALVERGPTPSFAPQSVNAVVARTGTNIEAALRTARIALSGAESPRIVLLSDGRQTRGDALAEAARAKAEAIPIDVEGVSVPASSMPRVVHLKTPSVARVDEPFIVAATVRGTPGSTSKVTLQSGGETVEQSVVLSAYGVATASFAGRSRQPGMRVYRASARSATGDSMSDVQESADQAGAAVIVSGQPQLLYVTSDGGSRASLAADGFRVVVVPRLPRSVAQLDQYEAIVLDDVQADDLDTAQSSALADYVERFGGGVLMLGSPRSLEPGLLANAALDRLLPVDVRPRSGQRSAGLALVVIFDKSGSMDDQVSGARKIDFARQAIQRALESVSPTDSAGVIAFDASPVPVAPLRAGQDPRAIGEALRSIAPSGPTAIAPTAELARQWLDAAPVDPARRHVLLISDGQTSAPDAARLRALVAERRFTLSVVALGGERDRQLLTSLAQSSGGHAFFPEDIRQVPTLVAREVARVAGGRLVETPFVVRPSPHALLSGFGANDWPQLRGYVASALRPGAQSPLRSHLDDPILATWRVGLGRVAVYTADLSSRWSDALRAWRGFDQLMSQTVRWVSRDAEDNSLSVRFVSVDDGMRVLLESYGTDEEPSGLADVHATLRRPAGEIENLDLRGSTPGLYEAEVSAAETGAHAITIDVAGDAGSERHITRGFYFSGEREHRYSGVDRSLLAAIAQTTGGTILGPRDSPFASQRPSSHISTRPWLLVAALALFLVEVFGPGLAALVSRRRADAHGAGASRENAA
jgi:Mg-chelatase subunit ChlD